MTQKERNIIKYQTRVRMLSRDPVGNAKLIKKAERNLRKWQKVVEVE